MGSLVPLWPLPYYLQRLDWEPQGTAEISSFQQHSTEGLCSGPASLTVPHRGLGTIRRIWAQMESWE